MMVHAEYTPIALGAVMCPGWLHALAPFAHVKELMVNVEKLVLAQRDLRVQSRKILSHLIVHVLKIRCCDVMIVMMMMMMLIVP